jgi:DNA-binding MarR family transcriptional regulator
VVDDLQSRGLVERRPDPGDRRATLVALTEEGNRIHAAIRTARQTEAERLFADLDPADRDELARILRTLGG